VSNVTGQFRFGSAVGGAVVGFEAGLFGVSELACGVLWPQSDLCGLPAVITAASLGTIAGGAIGWRIAPGIRPLVIGFNQLQVEDSRTGDAVRFALAALAGLSTTLLLDARSSGLLRESYWTLIIPLFCILSATIGYSAPKRAWIAGVAPLFGQWLWQIIAHGDQIGIGNLGPFAHVVVLGQYALAAIPGVIAAEIAAYVSRRRSAAGKT